jgi:hypothetical protein
MERSNMGVFVEKTFVNGDETQQRLSSLSFLLILILIPLRTPITLQRRFATMALSILLSLQLVLFDRGCDRIFFQGYVVDDTHDASGCPAEFLEYRER